MATTRKGKTLKKIVENHGNVSKAMRESGYSESYSKNPHEFKKTKAFQRMLDEVIPETEVLKAHKKLLHKCEAFVSGGKVVRSRQPHSDVKGAVDMAYKLRGSYSPEQVEVQNSLKDLSDDELEALYFELKKEESANTPKRRTKKRSNKRTSKPAAKRKV